MQPKRPTPPKFPLVMFEDKNMTLRIAEGYKNGKKIYVIQRRVFFFFWDTTFTSYDTLEEAKEYLEAYNARKKEYNSKFKATKIIFDDEKI